MDLQHSRAHGSLGVESGAELRRELMKLQKKQHMKRSHSGSEISELKRIKLAVCAMEKKTKSKPMREILSRLADTGDFEIIHFTDEQIQNLPVSAWPDCNALVSFFSKGFPLEKAIKYAAGSDVFEVNCLTSQRTLLDRREVYRTLQQNAIPVPTHIIVNRDGWEGHPETVLIEGDDYVEVDGKRIYKPFVEKPVDAEDHNIHIYYPSTVGGGSKRLFRKVKNQSSRFYPDGNELRKDGSFIYEEFITTQGTDVKVYTVGSDYAHAEARKSPVLDGKVLRQKNGKEVRYPVILTVTEKEFARKIVHAFKQHVCGFDLLRMPEGESYVCDVNGWSFVKNSTKYYDDTATLLRTFMLTHLAPERIRSPLVPFSRY